MENEILKTLLSLSTSQAEAMRENSRVLDLHNRMMNKMLITLVACVALVCGVMFYMIHEAYDYEDYPTTDINNTNNMEVGN